MWELLFEAMRFFVRFAAASGVGSLVSKLAWLRELAAPHVAALLCVVSRTAGRQGSQAAWDGGHHPF
jgi:hypothetical protein